MQRLKYTDSDFFKKLEDFNTEKSKSAVIENTVREILADIELRGDAAVLDYSKKFDGFSCSVEELRISSGELTQAEAALSEFQREKILEAIECVRSFHVHGLPKSWKAINPHGAIVGERWYPIERVGIYIPAGNVPLVSTAVMTTTLARLAGVKEIAVFTPAGKNGRISQQMMAGLSLCGIEEVYRVGGAQAVGAMAYGTATIPRVSKIMGPGNAFVAEAQRQVFGTVGVDLLPGPSEALAIADETANPQWLAADLIAQAEHGSGREKVYYVYTDSDQAEEVEKAILEQIPSRKHAKAIRKVWDESTLFIEVPHLKAGIEVCNFVAPEHLELHVDKEKFGELIESIHTAGAILCGHETPTVLGDFTAGPSHTLPTGRTGHFFSGLKITDFMRRSSIVEYDQESLAAAKGVVQVFAELEDLDGHGFSMEIRGQ